jgi:peptidoglycan-associated lipoprotein
MRLDVRAAAVLAALALGTAACGGQQPPPAPPPTVEQAPQPNADSLAAARAAQREAEASRICAEAESAMAAGNYDRARDLYQRAMSEYSGTECANTAATMVQKLDAISVIRERVHFEFDRSRITDEAAAKLKEKATVLQRYPNVLITIEGNCDERGSLEYNQALGQRRAESAKRYLENLGIAANRMNTISYGEERPIATGSNETAWAMNRRDEFVIRNADAL